MTTVSEPEPEEDYMQRAQLGIAIVALVLSCFNLLAWVTTRMADDDRPTAPATTGPTIPAAAPWAPSCDGEGGRIYTTPQGGITWAPGGKTCAGVHP